MFVRVRFTANSSVRLTNNSDRGEIKPYCTRQRVKNNLLEGLKVRWSVKSMMEIFS